MKQSKFIQIYKDAYIGHPRAIWLIAIITLINRLGKMVIPFLSVYLTTILGYSLTMAGYILGAFGLGSVAGSYIGGKLADRFGSHSIMTISLILGGISFILMQYFKSPVALISSVFVTAMIADAFRPAMSVFVGEHSKPGTAGRSMALIRIAINLGMALGPAVGGFIAFYLGYSALFWIDGGTCIAAGVILAILLYKWQIESTQHKKEVNLTATDSEPSVFKDKRYMQMLLVTLLLAIAFLQYFHTVPVFIKTEWNFDERFLGAMMAVNCIIIVITELPLVDWIEKAKKGPWAMYIGLFFFTGAFIPFLGSSSLWLYLIAILFFTAGEILYLPFNNAHALELSPEKGRGAYMSWYWMVWGVASIIAPILGFRLIDWIGYSYFWCVLVGLILLAAFIHRRTMYKAD